MNDEKEPPAAPVASPLDGQAEAQMCIRDSLCDVLKRMEMHHEKKTAMLRRLSISEIAPGEDGARGARPETCRG